jgi:hypothetical protein
MLLEAADEEEEALADELAVPLEPPLVAEPLEPEPEPDPEPEEPEEPVAEEPLPVPVAVPPEVVTATPVWVAPLPPRTTVVDEPTETEKVVSVEEMLSTRPVTPVGRPAGIVATSG